MIRLRCRKDPAVNRHIASTLVALTLVAAGATGCKPISATTATASSAQTRAGHLLEVHDPRHVTGTAPTVCHALSGPRPDPTCTPGAIDPAVTQANLASTICKSGYTATVRPPTSQTNKLKAQMYMAYGIPAGTISELDHDVPLELGGANDVANLWPEVGKQPNSKDIKAENPLHALVCARVWHGGKTPYLPLTVAQQLIAADWMTAVSKSRQYMIAG